MSWCMCAMIRSGRRTSQPIRPVSVAGWREAPGGLVGGEVEQDHGVVVGSGGLGVVGGHALAGCAFQLHRLVSEGEGADLRVVEGLAALAVAFHLVAFPRPAKSVLLSGSSPTNWTRSGVSGSVPARARRRATARLDVGVQHPPVALGAEPLYLGDSDWAGPGHRRGRLRWPG